MAGAQEEDDGDAPRLWSQQGKYPGTAFTRSIGDATAEAIGVFAEPEVLVKRLTARNPFLILASDGVWEFLSSQSVVDMVSKYDDPLEAAMAIVAESYRLWLEHESRTDDITMLIIQITVRLSFIHARTSEVNSPPKFNVMMIPYPFVPADKAVQSY